MKKLITCTTIVYDLCMWKMSEVEQKQGLPFIWYGGPPDKAKTVVCLLNKIKECLLCCGPRT